MEYVIEMLGITKEFPGIKANDNITLQIRKGEIHALLGENGAGKSTLMSVLFGMYRPEAGVIKLDGQPVDIDSPRTANNLGIGMVHQHFKLVENFTVLENIILGAETTKRGILQKAQARERVVALSKQYNLHVDPDALISDITVGMQQRVEILKMLYRDNRILIFDEPTAVLTPQEVEELMGIMKGLAAEGKSIIFITHKLNEIKQVADRCTVLRLGKYVGTVDVADVSKEQMSEMMVGRAVSLVVDKTPAQPGDVVLDVSNLCVAGVNAEKNKVNNVSFNVRKGEIVCIAGIDGNGQSELVYALTGLAPIKSGAMSFNGEDWTHKSIRYRNANGMAHIPEDRHRHGLILDFALSDNIVLQTYFTDRFQKNGIRNESAIVQATDELIEDFDIRTSSGAETLARSMSGGNQQKAIAAREISRNPELLIAVQPTRGLDVGAIEYMHKRLVEQRDKGSAVLLISLELSEVMSVSDRILVMYEGEIVADVKPEEIDIKELGLYMAGSKRNEVHS